MFATLARSTRRHPTLWVIVALTAPVALFYLPLLLGTHTFPDGDFTHHFLPFSLNRSEALRNLHLPLWNPATYSGHPFLADTQAAVFYPVSAILEAATLLWRDAAARLYWLQIEAILETILAGGFVYLLVRAMGVARWASILGGVTFALSGYLTAYPPLQLAVLRTVIWLPCLLWLLLRSAQSPRKWRYPLALALVTAVTISAGHPQSWLHAGYMALAWTLFLAVLLGWTQAWQRSLRYLGISVVASAAGILLAMAQLLPSLEFLQLSVRANVDYDFVSGGFPLQDSWQLLLPGVLTLWSPLFVGAPALLLAIFTLASPPPIEARGVSFPNWRATAWFFLTVAVLALFVSFGENGFLYPIVYRFLPGWNLFRGQERAALLVALSLSVLAGMGAHAFSAASARARRRLTVILFVGLGAALLVYLIAWQLAGDSAVGERQYLWIAGTVLLTSFLVVLLGWRLGWSDARSLGLLAVTIAALFIANYGINLEKVTPTERMTIAPELIALQEAVADDLGADNTTRVYNEYRAYEDYAMRLGLEDLWGSSPLRLAHYAAFNEQFPLDRWWRLTGVSHLLTWRAELFEPSEVLDSFPQATDTTYLHLLAEPNPRAWFVTGVTEANDQDALSMLADHAFDLNAIAILPTESGAVASNTPPAVATNTPVTVTRLGPESLRLNLDARANGLLVVTENWMPGWRVDNYGIGADDTAPILGLPAFVPQRANLSFLAIPVPSGVHELTLTYAPESVTLGLWISATTLLALFAVGLWRYMFVPRSSP